MPTLRRLAQAFPGLLARYARWTVKGSYDEERRPPLRSAGSASILADVVAVRNGHEGGRLSTAAGRIHEVGA
jgi:hypothetical protein